MGRFGEIESTKNPDHFGGIYEAEMTRHEIMLIVATKYLLQNIMKISEITKLESRFCVYVNPTNFIEHQRRKEKETIINHL